MPEQVQSGGSFPVITRGSVTTLSLYEVTDYELDVLEQGSPANLYLNFSIFMISTGISFLVSITTTKITDIRLFTVYVVCSVVGIVGGLLLLGLWYKNRKSVKTLCLKIRGRIVQDTAQPSFSEDAQTE